MTLRYLTEDQIQIEILKGEFEDNFGSGSSDYDPGFIETQGPLGTEESECSEGDVTPTVPKDCLVAGSQMNVLFTGKSGYKWHTMDPPRRGRTRAEDIVPH